MSGYWKNRKRPRSIAFHVSDEERNIVTAKALLAGLSNGEYCRRCTLEQKIEVRIGKYQSDRLALEFCRLRKTLETVNGSEEIADTLTECRTFLEQMICLSDRGDIHGE